MNIEKLISKLQSRIAKRKPMIKACWQDYDNYLFSLDKDCAILFGNDQKLDKQLLQQLYFDRNFERSLLERGL